MPTTQAIDIAQLPAYLKQLAGRLNGMSLQPALEKCKLVLVAETKQNFARGQTPEGTPWKPLKMPRARGAGKPLRDRGLLMASLTAGKGHREEITATTLIWGTNLEYAAVHQYGATIRPKSGRALAIPLTPEALRQGPRQFPGELFVHWPSGKSSGQLIERKGRGKPVAHYLLVSKVTIPARPFLGWTEKMADRCGRIIGEFVEKQLG